MTRPEARPFALASWREKLAREKNLARGFVVPDARSGKPGQQLRLRRTGLPLSRRLVGSASDLVGSELLEQRAAPRAIQARARLVEQRYL